MTATNPILLVSYYFPPLGLAGTARAVYLANTLSAAGHAVTVLTVKPIAYPAYDASLLDRLDPRVRVVRSGSLDPARIQKLLPFLPVEWLKRRRKQSGAAPPFPDSKRGFVEPALAKARQVIAPNSIVITTSPPISAHVVGQRLKQEFGVRWIADFRDIWSSLPPENQHLDFRRRAEQLMREIVIAADALTATSPLTAEHLRSLMPDVEKRTACIVNGFDERDFSGEIANAPLTFGYYGTINELSGFARVLGFVARWRELSREDWRIYHVGHLTLPRLPELLNQFDLAGKFTSTGYISHPQAVPLIRRAAINLLSLDFDRDTRFIVPSRLFELLRAEPPLIAVVPQESAVRRVLSEESRDFAAAVSEPEEFTAVVRRFSSYDCNNNRDARLAVVNRFAWPQTLGGFASLIAELPQ